VAPAERAVLGPGRHIVTGWAWGAWEVARVEVSADGGASWLEARLGARGPAPTWQPFTWEWAVAMPGAYQLSCRATDCRGRVQPSAGRNRIHGVAVTVA
jgi:hypothetical protein